MMIHIIITMMIMIGNHIDEFNCSPNYYYPDLYEEFD